MGRCFHPCNTDRRHTSLQILGISHYHQRCKAPVGWVVPVGKELETVMGMEAMVGTEAMVEMAREEPPMCSPPPSAWGSTSNQGLLTGMLIHRDSMHYRHILHHQMGTRRDPRRCMLNLRQTIEEVGLEPRGKPTLLARH